MISRIPVKSQAQGFQAGDVLVLFGELFQRGYANGLVEEAQAKGLQIIYATVGRREKVEGGRDLLRPLRSEELGAAPSPLINVPLEAGFDLEPDSEGVSPVERLAGLKLPDWESAPLNLMQIEEAHDSGKKRFQTQVREFVRQLRLILPKDRNILFAHLMAGGVPRAKLVLPLMNRAFKGTGERHLSSEALWNSHIGRFCERSFESVTAETLQVLLDETADLRSEMANRGQQVSYLAYGYHGTEIYFDGRFQWQSYTPYLQGWAKRKLEAIATDATAKGIACSVYNCPEILTNSTTIFLGVEVSLYPLLRALKVLRPGAKLTNQVWDECQSRLQPGVDLETVLQEIDKYLKNPLIRESCDFKQWPKHNSREQMELMLSTSDRVLTQHISDKNLITSVLSELVFKACGKLMLADAFKPKHAVSWIGHDAVVEAIAPH